MRSSLALALASLLFAATLRAETLNDCFTDALKRSETLAESGESIVQAEEQLRQARGAILPNLTLNYSYLRQDDHAYTPALAQSDPANQTDLNVTLAQPLFRGFAEYAALREVKDSLAAARDADRWAGIQLYQDVAQVFFTVLSLERSKQLIEDEIKLYDGRIAELKDFLAIGRSRPSDVETVQADQALLQATEVQLDEQVAVEREALAFLTGKGPDLALSADEAIPADAGSLDGLLKGLDGRPDLHAAIEKNEAAKELVAVNHGAHLPSIDLLGHWYASPRTGTDSPISWDGSIMATLPLFEGFTLVSRDRSAESQQRQAELELSRQRRMAESAVRTAWRTLNGDLAQITAFDRGFTLANKAYESLKRDYEHGLDTNQDVLLALTSSRDAQRSLEAAKFAARNDNEQLQALAGRRMDLVQDRQ